jgi:hypothetical protein
MLRKLIENARRVGLGGGFDGCLSSSHRYRISG